ncbi:MAG: hypothetical protein ABID38_03960 [Candidatus Diapherotrites archaeon]
MNLDKNQKLLIVLGIVLVAIIAFAYIMGWFGMGGVTSEEVAELENLENNFEEGIGVNLSCSFEADQIAEDARTVCCRPDQGEDIGMRLSPDNMPPICSIRLEGSTQILCCIFANTS